MIRKDFLPLARPDIGSDEISFVSEVIKSGHLTTGPKVFEFENKFAEYLTEDTPLFASCLISGTAALFMALKVLGIKKGHEVIVPTWTFAATSQVVEWLGAKPVFCDILDGSLTINPENAERLITGKTRAIIPVHIGGYPYEIDSIQSLARKHNLLIIEDAAHAIGTQYKGTKVGNFADITCFSFYATKNLAMGEGGAVVGKDSGIIEKIAKLAYFGINKEAYKRYDKAGSWLYDIEELGYKYNLDSMHAALGLAQLGKLDAMNEKRRKIAKRYKKELSSAISYMDDSEEHFHTYHLFQIILPEGVDINQFIIRLKERNIGANIHFIPLHKHSFYKDRFQHNQFPVANKCYEKVVSIPMFPSMTDGDVEYVIYHINNILGH